MLPKIERANLNSFCTWIQTWNEKTPQFFYNFLNTYSSSKTAIKSYLKLNLNTIESKFMSR